MSPIPLGIWATAGGGAAAGAYELISTSLISTNTTTVTFSSLPSDYTHLQIRWTARTNFADYQDSMSIRLNGVSTATYTPHSFYASGTSGAVAVDSATTSIYAPNTTDMFATNEAANLFGAGIIDINDFKSATNRKTVRMMSGVAGGFQARYISLSSGLNGATGALTSVTLRSKNSASFVSGSRFSIYGIKG